MYSYKESLYEMVTRDQGNSYEASTEQEELVRNEAENPTRELRLASTENQEMGNQLVPYQGFAVGVAQVYVPKDEDDLIDYTSSIYGNLQTGCVLTYWHIGQAIDAFYQKKYGQNELKRIADETGVHVDTLRKACRFARQFSWEQVDALLKGRYQISWNQVAQNLSVESEKVVEVYESSENPGEFNRSIINFKNPEENRGKVKKVQQVAPPDLETERTDNLGEENEDIRTENCGPILERAIPVEPEVIEDGRVEEVPTKEMVRDSGEIEALKKEINDLKKQVAERDRLLAQSERIFREMNQDLEENVDKLENLKLRLEHMQTAIDNGMNHVNLLAMISQILTDFFRN